MRFEQVLDEGHQNLTTASFFKSGASHVSYYRDANEHEIGHQ